MAFSPQSKAVHRSQLRLPAELANWLRHQAGDKFHSLNAEIVQRLRQSQAQEQKEAQR